MRGQQGSLPSSFTSVHLSRGALSHCSSVSSEAKSKTWARCVDERGQESLVRDMNSMVLVLHLSVASWLLYMPAGAKMEDGIHSQSYTPDQFN